MPLCRTNNALKTPLINADMVKKKYNLWGSSEGSCQIWSRMLCWDDAGAWVGALSSAKPINLPLASLLLLLKAPPLIYFFLRASWSFYAAAGQAWLCSSNSSSKGSLLQQTWAEFSWREKKKILVGHQKASHPATLALSDMPSLASQLHLPGAALTATLLPPFFFFPYLLFAVSF